MKNVKMKKTIILILALVIVVVFGSATVATEHSDVPDPVEIEIEQKDENTEVSVEEDLNASSEKVLNNVTKKDKRKAELIDKYNDELYGTVAYWLEVAQKYSLPVCFIGITLGSFNFLILGNKKLDKKEQGFGWIVAFTIALVVFNVIPLIFALLVTAGR